jgi:hypothetical protein
MSDSVRAHRRRAKVICDDNTERPPWRSALRVYAKESTRDLCNGLAGRLVRLSARRNHLAELK